MPDPYERHSRSSWEWGSPGARSQERAAAAHDDPTRNRTPGKKDPGLCKGEHWKGPHRTEVLPRPYGRPTSRGCGWRASYGKDQAPWWSCYHREICIGCQKDFGAVSPQRCPLFHEITPADQKRIDVEVAAWEERRKTWRSPRKPVITGPQGYRKKKQDPS